MTITFVHTNVYIADFYISLNQIHTESAIIVCQNHSALVVKRINVILVMKVILLGLMAIYMADTIFTMV